VPRPMRAAPIAASHPAWPAPTTTTSYFSVKPMDIARSRASVSVGIILADSEPAAKIEEVGKRQFPAGKLARGELLIAREGGVQRVLFPLQLQDLHGLGQRIKEPDLRDSRLCI